MTKPTIAGAGLVSHGTRHGDVVSLAPTIKPIWARIADSDHNHGFGKDDKPTDYEWRAVYIDEDGEWQEFYDVPRNPHESQIVKTDEPDEPNTVYNPAVEINGGPPPFGDVVRLIPGKVLIDNAGNSHRQWLFSVTPTIRPFVLSEDLIPDARDPGAGERELYRTVKAAFIDGTGDDFLEDVTLYPAHRTVWREEPFDSDDDNDGHTWDQLVSLGFAWESASGTFAQRGTMGWAVWKAKATRLDYNEDGSVKWRGEWQIVTLYAEQIAQLEVKDTLIDAGEVGKATWLHLAHNTEPPTRIDSGYEVEVFNDLTTPLHVGDIFKAVFSRAHYLFIPLAAPDHLRYGIVQAGFTNASGSAHRTVSIKSCDQSGGNVVGAAFNAETELRPNLDTNLVTGDVVRWDTAKDGTVMVVSYVFDEPIGTVIWESINTANIRNSHGWYLADGANGTNNLSKRFVMCVDVGGQADEDAIGDTGGFRDHGGATNDHTDHQHDNNHAYHGAAPFDFQVYAGTGGHYEPHSGHDHDETDNRPLYYVLAARQRVS